MPALLQKLARNPNAGHLALALLIATGGGANYSRVDQVGADVAALRAEQATEKDKRRDLEVRVAVIESQHRSGTP